MKMIMKRIVFLAVLLAFAIPTRLAANGHNAECNPRNRAVIPSTFSDTGVNETGATRASGHAKAFFEEIEGDFNGTATDLGGAYVEFEFEAEIDGPNTVADPGKASGELEVEIHWTEPSMTGGVEETELHSGCVGELETGQQPAFVNGTDVDNVGEFEGELEGVVHDFPLFPHTRKAAVGSVAIKADVDDNGNPTGLVEADLSIELGTTCKEDGTGNPNVELEQIAFKGLDPDKFKINNVGAHGVWNFPIGISTADDSCTPKP